MIERTIRPLNVPAFSIFRNKPRGRALKGCKMLRYGRYALSVLILSIFFPFVSLAAEFTGHACYPYTTEKFNPYEMDKGLRAAVAEEALLTVPSLIYSFHEVRDGELKAVIIDQVGSCLSNTEILSYSQDKEKKKICVEFRTVIFEDKAVDLFNDVTERDLDPKNLTKERYDKLAKQLKQRADLKIRELIGAEIKETLNRDALVILANTQEPREINLEEVVINAVRSGNKADGQGLPAFYDELESIQEIALRKGWTDGKGGEFKEGMQYVYDILHMQDAIGFETSKFEFRDKNKLVREAVLAVFSVIVGDEDLFRKMRKGQKLEILSVGFTDSIPVKEITYDKALKDRAFALKNDPGCPSKYTPDTNNLDAYPIPFSSGDVVYEPDRKGKNGEKIRFGPIGEIKKGKIMDNCELSCARGYEGIVYLRDILFQYFSNEIGPSRKKIDPNTLFVFAYSGKGVDSERKEQGQKRKIVLVLRQARRL